MKKELCEQLYLDYPHVYATKISIDCGNGWFNLIDHLSSMLESWIQELEPGLGSQIWVEQVKEKYGSLRFYMSHETAMMTGAIALAEDLSLNICEKCGHPGMARGGGWVKTLCDACHTED